MLNKMIVNFCHSLETAVAPSCLLKTLDSFLGQEPRQLPLSLTRLCVSGHLFHFPEWCPRLAQGSYFPACYFCLHVMLTIAISYHMLVTVSVLLNSYS